jgi:hypothetical protein
MKFKTGGGPEYFSQTDINSVDRGRRRRGKMTR